MNASGPDIAAIQCRPPDGCCGVSPCAIDEDEFICQIRSLLPEGDVFNTTLPPSLPPALTAPAGAITVGCSIVGCEQLVFGGCCDDEAVCDVVPVAPQIAVVDAFASAAHGAVAALCQMLRELDPCTADLTLRKWGERFGITHPDCNGEWSDEVLATLICVMLQIRLHVINLEYLTTLAKLFGAEFVIRNAGDMNCGPDGWWTMARDRNECPPPVTCGDDAPPRRFDSGQSLRLDPTCISLPDSLNLILSPGDIYLPPNCNYPPVPDHLPHDPERYEAFKWLLTRILPQPVFWCIYERDAENCIV